MGWEGLHHHIISGTVTLAFCSLITPPNTKRMWERFLPPSTITTQIQALLESSPCGLLPRKTRGAFGILRAGAHSTFSHRLMTSDVPANRIACMKALHRLGNGYEERKNLINHYHSGGIDPGLMPDRRKGPGSWECSIRCEEKKRRQLLRPPCD